MNARCTSGNDRILPIALKFSHDSSLVGSPSRKQLRCGRMFNDSVLRMVELTVE